MDMVLLIACLNFAIWTYLLLARGRFWRVGKLDASNFPSPAAWPDICVIIPARNEAEVLAETLPSLFSNDYPGSLRIVLIDDRSEDATADIASRIAAQYDASDCMTVITAPALPAGWSGKVCAMQCGFEQVATTARPPRYLLFTDADIRYDKGALTRLVARAQAHDFVLTSLMVRLRCQSPAERWLIPAFVYFFRLLYPFSWVNDLRRATAAAAGGCMLARYDTLLKTGGLKPIRTALIDDCAMGRMMKTQGPIWLGLTQEVHSVRPYPCVSEIRAMVARSAYDQLGYSPLLLLSALLGIMLTYITPVLLTLFSHGTAQLLGAASWAMMSASFLPMLRLYRRSPLASLMLPAIAAAYMGFTLDSAWQYLRGKGGLWKGRVQARAA